MSKTTIRLTGPALEAARGVHHLHLEAHAKKAELEREFQESVRRLGAEVQEQMTARWKELLTAAGLPEEDLGKWQLDASYLTEHGCAFLEPGTGLTMDLDKFYIISDSGSSFTPMGFSSVEEATRWAQASASTFGDLEVTVPKFKGASEGWDEMGSCNVVAARDLLEFWKANPLSQGEPA